ncbi:MAG TPA: succinate dehydrogenase, hydrophobic membrane anchor protein [Burkholderiaceae bacterium]|nr:succinate dehydrogenase, hydrophobic membrane anchor protein [Burkholderiaceae bacterium]
MTTRRIVVGAHYGLRDWLMQRVTAVVLLVYTLLLLGAVLFTRELDYGSWAALFSNVWMKVATVMAVLSLVYHTWVGTRDIYMDYFKPTGLRLVATLGTLILLFSYAVWAVIILWRV